MKLLETIKSILKEESEIPISLRRRMSYIDEYFRDSTQDWGLNLCDFNSGQQLMDKLIFDTIEKMYYIFYTDIDDTSTEWFNIAEHIEKYLIKKYMNDVEKSYHINCGN
jgi:hypothetical protein